MAHFYNQGTLSHVGFWKCPGGAIIPVYRWSLAADIETLRSKIPNDTSFFTYYLNESFQPPISSIASTLYGDFMARSINIPQDTEFGPTPVELYGFNFAMKGFSSPTYNYLNVGSYGASGNWLAGIEVSTRPYTTTDLYKISSTGRVGFVILEVDGQDGTSYYYRCLGEFYFSGSVKGIESYITLAKDNTERTDDWGPQFFGIKVFYSGDSPDFNGEYIPGTTPPPPNPYEPGGDSGEGGGDGTFDDSSDQIADSTPPTISSANTGFTRIYNPTLSQVQALAEYLWTDESVIQTIWNHIKQYFENPMEAMIGFNLVPVTVPDGGTTTFKLMYIDTGVSMTAAASQFVDTDCGTLKLEPYYGSALDYSPYTKVSIFLPYIGMVSVDTDEVMGRTMQVKYRTDICSGACVAKILVDGNVLYQYTGHCAINIPFSAADFSSYVSAVMSTAKLAGTLALGASGALGPVAVSEITQQTGEAVTKTVNTERNPETGRQITLSSQTKTKAPSEITTTKASYAGISPSNVTNTVGEVISSKPHVEHSGSFSGTSGYLGVRRPYVIIKRPNMCMPSNYQSLNGFPCMITLKLGDCKGFTRVQQVVLSKMGKATNPEQAEILGLLKNGVIL